MSDKPVMHGWDHRPRYRIPGGRTIGPGMDPVHDGGIINHWMHTTNTVSAASDGGAPGAPTPINVPFNAPIDKSTDDAGDIYVAKTGTVNYIAVLEPGGYELRLIATMTAGQPNYMSVAPVINGDAWTGVADTPSYIPASFGGTGGGVMVYRLPFYVEESATLGGTHEVKIFAAVWQNSGSTHDINVALFIRRTS